MNVLVGALTGVEVDSRSLDVSKLVPLFLASSLRASALTQLTTRTRRGLFNHHHLVVSLVQQRGDDDALGRRALVRTLKPIASLTIVSGARKTTTTTTKLDVESPLEHCTWLTFK